MFLTESTTKWSQLLTEELGITDKSKLSWMSQLASVHEIKEGLQTSSTLGGSIYSNPLNTTGMGNPAMPTGVGFNATSGSGVGNTGADFHNPAYQVGSGDQLPMSTLSMALNIAAMTIGFELVPVIVSQGPWQMLSYMDFPYAGGKLGRFNETAMDGKGPGAENKPIYIKISGSRYALKAAKDATNGFVAKEVVTLTTKDSASTTVGVITGKYLGSSRIDNNIIIEITSVVNGSSANISIADAFDATSFKLAGATHYTTGLDLKATDSTGTLDATTVVRPDFVATMADHIQGFSNFFDGSDDAMTRAQNETGVGNTIGARMFTKLIQMGSYEVTGSVTRQQLQDMPLYGVDVIGKVLESMQNEISQNINNRILDRVFKLGVTNAITQKDYQNVDLNLYISTSVDPAVQSTTISALVGNKYVGVDDVNYGTNWTLTNAIANTSAENITTAQRRIASRILAASNVIAQVGRRGRANWVVTNTQVVSALQDSANFIIAPMVNTLSQDGSQSLYFAGSICGLNVYVDPYMDWDDTRVCVGRKGDGNTPGVIFMPYILADTVQTVVEGTMAPKLLVNSRYALVDAGFYPEFNYLTFVVGTNDGNLFV